MKPQETPGRWLMVISMLSVVLVVASGCGGGSGLGIQGVAFRGTLTVAPDTPTDQILPLGGVRITLVDTGHSTTTSSDGSYVLQTIENLTTAEFFFFGSGVNATFILTDIPENAISVAVNFQVNRTGDTVVSTGVVMGD